MNKKWTFFLAGLTIVFVTVGVWFVTLNQKKPSPSPIHLKVSHGPYFFPISVIKFNAANIPCLLLTIGDQTISTKLDLGFEGNVSCLREVLAKIEDKKYLRTRKMYKFRGVCREEKIFVMPPFSLGKIVFSNMECQEDDVEFRTIGSLLKEGEEVSLSEPAIIGWHLFRTVNLLLDLGNSKIAFCDSLATLQNEGYADRRFVKSELLIKRGFIECNVTLPEGPLRCVLDTGCTWNILHKELEDNQLVEQMAWGPNNVRHVPSLKIGEIDFGAVDFHYLPVNLPIDVQAFLGMEFLSKHIVFIDFAENCIYFSPTQS
jgi:hypothetical protein